MRVSAATGNMVHRSSRRAALRLAATATVGTLLAACGDIGGPASVSTPTPTTTRSPAASTPAPTLTAPSAPAPTAAPTAPTATSPPAIAATAAPAGGGTTSTGAMVAASPMTTTDRIASTVPGVPDIYLKPPPVLKSVASVPGRGGKVTMFTIAYAAPPRPRADNRYWQELERRLGVTVEPTFVPAGAYAEKLSALMASGDIADLTWVGLLNAPGQNQAIQQGAYADLTPYVTGRALKDYPNLAAFPDQLWKNATIRGKIYGVPRPMLTPGDPLVYRRDWAETVGIPDPKNAEEFLQLMAAMTRNDPDGNGKADTYGMAGATTIAGSNFNLSFFMQDFRVPNVWRKNPDGSLTAAIETDEFKQTVAYQRRLFAAGIFHPDSATLTNAQRMDGFLAGKFGSFGTNLFIYGPTGLHAQLQQANPKGNAAVLLPFGHDGGRGVAHSGLNYFGFVCIPAKVGRDQGRVKELLRVLDYYAAPFGSDEQIFLNYGLEGLHHTVQPDGSRVVTDAYKADAGDFTGLTNGLPVLYYPGAPDAAITVQQLVKAEIEMGVANPALTAYSPTDAAKSGELSQLRIDRVNAVIVGREPLSALDQYVKEWRARGGDQIRKELEAELRAS